MDRKKIIGTLEIAAGSLGFGFLGIFGKWAFQSGLSVGELLTFRFILAAVILWFGLFILNRKKILLEPKQILISAGLGILGYAVFATLYFTAIQGMSVGLAALLLYTYPFWVSLLSHIFLNEKLSAGQWAVLAIALLGVNLLLWGQFRFSDLGALAAGLGSAITYAAYILVSAKHQRFVPPISSSLYVITAAAIALALFHQPRLDFALQMNSHQWAIVVGVATISTIFPMTMMLAGLQKTKSSHAALISMLEPIAAAIAAALILNESMSALQILGATLILCCLIYSIVRKH